MSNGITFEEIVKLETQIVEKQLYEQYLQKLIELLGIRIQLYITTAEVDCPWTGDAREEIFRLCTAPLEARLEAANHVLACRSLPSQSNQSTH